MKRILILICLLFSGLYSLNAATTTVEVGKMELLYCTANAPAGYLTHAFFYLVDPDDAQYVQFSYNSSDLFATIVGIKAKASIKVEVQYHYAYLGTYDNRTHVGHGSYYTYITVTGGVAPTAVQITQGDDVKMRVGETVSLSAKLTPSNASADFAWGTLSGFGQPFAFDLTYIGPEAKVKANRSGEVYIIVQTSNDLYDFCVVTAVDEEVEPAAIKMEKDEVKISVGQALKLKCSLEPDAAAKELTWTSSDEGIVTVSSDGKITGVKPGEAVIVATTVNGLSAETKVRVLPQPSDVKIISQETLYVGYPYQLTPVLTPEESIASFTWTSSDPLAAYVTSTGKVVAKKACDVTITVTTDAGLSAECNLSFQMPPMGLDHRNMGVRVRQIKKIVDKSLENNRK